MLVLTRKENETLKIGDDVVITFKSIGRSRCVVSIDAPQHVRILRGELPPLTEKDSDATA